MSIISAMVVALVAFGSHYAAASSNKIDHYALDKNAVGYCLALTGELMLWRVGTDKIAAYLGLLMQLVEALLQHCKPRGHQRFCLHAGF